MNKIEIQAYNWLLNQGIKKEDIEFRSHKTPDFIIKDGKKYEIKKGIGKKIKRILIEERQFPSLIKDPNTKILIFETGLNKPSAILPVNKLKKGIKRIDNISITWKKFNKNIVSRKIEVPEEIWAEFRKTLMKDDVINSVVIKMIKKRIEEFK